MSNLISEIHLCSVPITPTNQLDFKTLQAQQEYFNSKCLKSYARCKYIPREGEIMVRGYVDDFIMQNVNYGYYINTYNGNAKTFYFWIANKDTVAKDTVKLTIQLDIFQTWLFDFDLKSCMVERETVSDDSFGAHTFPEDFELGDYITNSKQSIKELQGDLSYILALTDNDKIFGNTYGRIYSGFEMLYFGEEDVNALTNKIGELCKDGKADSIAFIFCYPYNFLKYYFVKGNFTPKVGEQLGGFNFALETDIKLKDTYKNGFNSYKPKNNKCYSYPFNFLTVKNPDGGNVVLKFENFTDADNIVFKLEGSVCQNPKFTLTPLNYAGKDFAIDDSIELGGFPLCSWNNDNYSNWFAQHKNSINAQSTNAINSYKMNNQVYNNQYENALDNNTMNMYKGIADTVGGAVSNLCSLNIGGAISGALGGAVNTAVDYYQSNENAKSDLTNKQLLNNNNYYNSIRSIVASVSDAQVQPNTCKGDTSASGLDVSRNTNTFFIEHTSIKPEYIKVIDNYFQMFGYQVNELKIPNFKTRKKWNFIKTVNCNCMGDIPLNDRNAINEMFNNGLTVWHSEEYMYNYDTVNKIL